VNLHEQLDDAFEAISPRPAPIEETMKRGTWIRRRKRATAMACVAAVVAAAVFVPLTAHWGFSSSPETSHYTVTVHQPGPHSPANEIAYGTVNGKSWQIFMGKSVGSTATGYGICSYGLGAALNLNQGVSQACEPPDGATPGDPVAFNGLATWGQDAEAVGFAGGVATDVSYVTVTLTDGAVLTLHPVTVYGSRYVAFATPAGTVARVTAYSRLGEIASSLAFTATGQDIFFSNAWLAPGQRGLPRVTGMIRLATVDESPGRRPSIKVRGESAQPATEASSPAYRPQPRSG
jgi:hypothetical protein